MNAESLYRIRLTGTEVVDIQGVAGTGKYVEEVLNRAEVATIVQGYGEIIRTHVPGYPAGVVATVGREQVPYSRMAFPLARDGENVDMLIFAFVSDGKPSSSVAATRR